MATRSSSDGKLAALPRALQSHAPAIRYRVCVADPPWKFGDALPGTSRGASRNYACLALHELQRFPLPLFEDDALLMLWRVSSMVEEAYAVCRAWGFTPKSEIVWRKLTATGKPWFGMGRIVRGAHETCIVATRGRFKPRVKNVRTIFDAPVGVHSEKPDEFYRLVESLSPGPRIELFARKRRNGWTCLGNELPQAAE